MAKKKRNANFALGTTGNDSAALNVADLLSVQIQVTASNWTAGSYQPMVSYDGSNFVNLGSAITGANGSVSVPDAAVAVKIHTTTAATAGGAAAVSGVTMPNEGL